MKKHVLLSGLFVFALLWTHTVLTAGSVEEVRLTGRYIGKEIHELEAPLLPQECMGANLTLSQYGDLPVIEQGLAEKAASMNPSEWIRIIVILKYQPQDVIAEDIRALHREEFDAIETEVKAANAIYAERRNPFASSDSENYRAAVLTQEPAEAEIIRAASKRHEALSLKINREIYASLSSEVKSDQESLRKFIESLGAKVECSIVCVNALIAEVPVFTLDSIASNGKVARVVEDKLFHGQLDNAAPTTLINALQGPWDSGFSGGLFDPAVLDCGTDMEHPALRDSDNRQNFYSLYLVAGHGDARWDDEVTHDDLHRHGTHIMGIVASYGSEGFLDHLGMAHGVEKTVTLKAGWLGTDLMVHMYQSDAMALVDRALYKSYQLEPVNSFNDDVDGLNLSYSHILGEDEDDYSRFWDSVISSYTDLLVTFAAGNSGPDNTEFESPACCFNGIAVGNVDDFNSPGRFDDLIANKSTRGPTATGRRKPDICAPGRFIKSCHNEWEDGVVFIDQGGTSMAAPMVLGAGMCLMDAGVYDEMKIKALLLNTAQKNDGTINFEDDPDGWDPAYGWGYMNAWAAFYHRNDVIKSSLTERPNAGYYRLYKGQMHDESFLGEGRDRVTLVWNRHATYNPIDYPTTYYDISDLNLCLYRESSNFMIDSDYTQDNVLQVRIHEDADFTDVVVNVYAWDTDFPHGGDTEEFALATEEDFVEVDFPSNFQAYGIWAHEMEPNEEADFKFWLANNSDIASHNNTFNLEIPSEWTLVSGSDPFDAGSLPGEGGTSATVTWRLKAQPSEEEGVTVTSDHAHHSYGIGWVHHDWYMPVNVRWDRTPPTPDPMTFAEPPYAVSTRSINMVATTAHDLHDPVEYFFDYSLSPTGGTGGSNSSWQTGTEFTDDGLEVNHQYGYRTKARDNAFASNHTRYSELKYAYTLANNPNTPIVDNPTSTTLDITIDPNGNPEWTEFVIWLSDMDCDGYYLNASGHSNGNTPVWNTAAAWGTVTAKGLEHNTEYAFKVQARNGDEIETGWTEWAYGTTLPPAEPIPDIDANGSDGPISVSADDTVRLTISLDAGDYVDVESDWWIFVESRFGTFSYVYPAGWKPGLRRTALFPLFNVPRIKLFAGTLPKGKHTFQFAVDGNDDGIPDLTWRDSVIINVSD